MSPWFEDRETRRWLGGREWAENLLGLVNDPPRGHHDASLAERLAYVARAEQIPVGLVDAEIYADRTAAVAIVIAPDRRREGLGSATLVALGAFLADRGVVALVGGVERGNVASAHCVERAGFTARTDDVDEEGFIDYVLRLDRPRGYRSR